jgi:CRISPR-associated endoribonuclease Cas6
MKPNKGVRNVGLKTTRARLGKSTIRGFKGWCKIMLEGDPLVVQVAWLLLCFAEYAGVGRKTAFGCGKVSLE